MNPAYGGSGPGSYDGRRPEPPYSTDDDLKEEISRLRDALQNCLDVHDGVGGTPHGVWDAARTILANDPQTDGGCSEDWDDSADFCPECDGLGTDKFCDHLLPCPLCHGDWQI